MNFVNKEINPSLAIIVKKANFPYRGLKRLNEPDGGNDSAAVFQAVDIRAGSRQQKVAIKIIAKKWVDEDDLRLIEREIWMLAMFTVHPGFIQLHEALQDEDNVYISTRWEPFGDLYGYLDTDDQIPPFEAAAIARQIALSLNFMHSKGIVHRDLKTENVLISSLKPVPRVKLADLGFACKIKSLSDPLNDLRVGTTEFMSPEVILGLPYTFDVDSWSFGVLIYELLSGEAPFQGEDDDDTERLITDPANTPETFNEWDSLDRDGQQLIKALLNRDPRSRTVMAAALSSPFLGNEAVLDLVAQVYQASTAVFSTPQSASRPSQSRNQPKHDDQGGLSWLAILCSVLVVLLNIVAWIGHAKAKAMVQPYVSKFLPDLTI